MRKYIAAAALVVGLMGCRDYDTGQQYKAASVKESVSAKKSPLEIKLDPWEKCGLSGDDKRDVESVMVYNPKTKEVIEVDRKCYFEARGIKDVKSTYRKIERDEDEDDEDCGCPN